MQIRKEALLLSGLAEKDYGHTRYSGVRFESDGSTVVTNGHYLAKYSPTVKVTDVPGCAGFTVTGKAAGDVCKAIGRGVFAEVDDEATNANGTARFCVGPVTIEAEKLDGDFVNYQKVIPVDAPAVVIGFDPAYLEKLGQWFKRVGAKTVKVSVYDADKPAKLEAVTENGEALAVLMPMHL